MSNTSHTNSFFPPSQGTKQEKHAKKKARFEKEGGKWWAIQNLGEDNILGHGKTKEEALVDLEHQVVGFVNFLKSTGRTVPDSLR